MHASRILAASLLALSSANVASAQSLREAEKLFFDACPPFAPRVTFDCYHDYAEVTSYLRTAADRYPGKARLESIGKTWQGRDLWVLTVTDFAAGEPDGKPALWVDAGIDADEVVATEAALGLIHRLLTSDEPRIAELLRTRTFYIAPVVIPDASQLQHTTAIRPRDTTLRPWDDDNDGAADEDAPDDLDGDDQALQMRVVDPAGEWVASEEDARLLRRRRAGDAGPFYTLYPEGLDDDDDGEFGEDPPGGVDPNRNYPGNWSAGQGGAGPYAASELELRAMLDFAIAHPNIAATQHYHSSGGVILRPPSVPDLDLPQADLDLFLEMSRLGLDVTGYDLATSVYDWNWPRGSRNTRRGQVWRDRDGEIQGFEPGGYSEAPARLADPPFDSSVRLEPAPGESAYPAFGGSIDAMYLLFGALAFANEIYTMGEDLDGDGRIEPHEQLVYNDSIQNGYAFRDWTRFDHPQLGAVEIGGWRKFGHNNPPPAELPEEVRRNVEFALLQAEHMQLLALADPQVVDLGDGVYRITVTVRNTGRVPTELAIAQQQNRAVPVRVEIEGAEVLTDDARQSIDVIGGYGEEEVQWVVRARPGATVEIRAWHPKAGRARVEVVVR